MVKPFEIPQQQRDVLATLVPEYLNIYTGSRMYNDFWPKATQLFFDNFPLLPSLFPGKTEKDLSASELEKYRTEYAKTYERVQKFYRWESFKYKKAQEKAKTIVIPAPDTGVRKKLYQAHEIYSKMYWSSRLDPIYKVEKKDGNVTRYNALSVRTRIARENYEKEDEETILAVTEQLKIENDAIIAARQALQETALEDIE
ncbi:hypothetical protein CVT24_003139, partial [Panaeolus cyanescens]